MFSRVHSLGLLGIDGYPVEVEADIARIEKGRVSVAEMGLKGQMQLESRLRELRIGKDELTKRWQALCRKEQHALKAQREQVLQSVHAALPALPDFTGNLQDDEVLIAQHCSILEKRLEEALLAEKVHFQDGAQRALLPKSQGQSPR